MARKNEIENPEAISKINLSNAVKFFESKEIQEASNHDNIQFYLDRIQKYMNVLAP